MKTKSKGGKSVTYKERKFRVAALAEHSLSMQKLLERFPEARTIVDATEDKVLIVTDGDVRSGQPKNPAGCALAKCALRQGLGGMIGRQFAYLINGSEVTRYNMGRDAKARTAMFDDRGTMTAGPVILSVPSPALRLGVMNRNQNVRKADLKKKRKVKNKKAQEIRTRDEKIRKYIASSGFRTWHHVA